jgi:ribonuclease HI
MDLDWGKQIQSMNKMIMDWRWKAFAAKTDPAQLKSSVVEYLFPKLEIGLAHAEITQKMCDAWMSTIIHTICQRADMRMSHSINRKGFCILADLPDLWMRMQTSRAIDLLVNINTKYSENGRSTRARLCSLVKVSAENVNRAVQEIKKKNRINYTATYRISSTLQYLKNFNVNIASNGGGDQRPLFIVSDIQKTIERFKDNMILPLTAFTDGSTNPKKSCANSGSGIVITDGANNPLWSGGLMVRSDGNNFIAELAAVSIVIKACPKDVPLMLHIDSTAAIGAISKGPLSERKRIRAAGRPWLNFCRTDLLEKHHYLKVVHISSHKGIETAEQRGNDMADAIANEYRRKGENKAPTPYFIESEEQFIFQYGSLNVQGDPRSFLKAREKEQMINIWKNKAPKQAQWFLKFPTQVQKQSKKLWRRAIELDRGSAWIYFIFAICQWLPVNHRIHYGESDSDMEKCKLCLMNTVEDTDHLYICPALSREQVMLHKSLEDKLKMWNVPYAHKSIESFDDRTCRLWFQRVKSTFQLPNHPQKSICSEKLWRLTKDFWYTNRHRNPKIASCLLSIQRVLNHTCQVCPATSVCVFQCGVIAPKELLSLLVQRLHLRIEGATNALYRSSSFSGWCSTEKDDKQFGSLGSLFESDLGGHNSFILTHDSKNPHTNRLHGIIQQWTSSQKPTRVVMIAPTQIVEPWFRPRDRKILEIAHSLTGFPLFHDNHSVDQLGPRLLSAEPMSIIIALNKESMILDPINWFALKSDLSEWALAHCPDLIISESCDNLFRERAFPSHKARASPTAEQRSNCAYQFTRAHPVKNREKHLIDCGIPADLARLIDRANRHEQALSALGILPNQLWTILRASTSNPEEAWLDISDTLFWQGYNIWISRKRLTKTYWNNIAPSEWNKYKKKPKSRKRKQRSSPSHCANPFHFLERRDNFSKEKPTKCFCYEFHRPSKHRANRDIRSFITTFPRLQPANFQNHLNLIENVLLQRVSPITTRQDLIRDQHDRGRKRKRKRLM